MTQVGIPTINSYVDRVRAVLSALPQEIRFVLRHDSTPLIFDSLAEVSKFLTKPNFKMGKPHKSYLYQITFSDGSEFEKTVASLQRLKQLHKQIELLVSHLNQITL
jgi:nicotinic acid phosphoribosyltransferase